MRNTTLSLVFASLACLLVAAIPAIAQDQTEGIVPGGDVVSYIDTDAVGSVRTITDATGAVVARYDYMPFGTLWNPSSFPSSRLFVGKERDAATALDYFGARYLADSLGRFVASDPDHVNGNTFDPQSWNAYAYGRNNPLGNTDPDGREYVVCADGSCGFVSDDFFGYLSEHPGSGFALSGGVIWQWTGEGYRYAGWYRQVSVDSPSNGFHGNQFERMVGDAGERASAGVKAVGTAMAIGGSIVAGGVAASMSVAVESLIASGPGALAELVARGKISVELLRRLYLQAPGLVTRAGDYLFARGGKGLLNGRLTGDLFRLGYGWEGSAEEGSRVFRIAIGSERLPIHWHYTLWRR